MSGTVFLVEDDRRIANWVKVYFERAGFSAEVAHDGESDLELARSLSPDLVILDLMLPPGSTAWSCAESCAGSRTFR